MGKSSGGNRSNRGGGRIKRTGAGFTESVNGPTVPSSKATEIQYVYVDKITGNQSNGYASLKAAKNAVYRADRDDKAAGAYEPDNYYIERVEQLKGKGRSTRYWNG